MKIRSKEAFSGICMFDLPLVRRPTARSILDDAIPPQRSLPRRLVAAVTASPPILVSGQQKARQWRVTDRLPPRRGYPCPTQQESSAHIGRVSGDPIPICAANLSAEDEKGQSL